MNRTIPGVTGLAQEWLRNPRPRRRPRLRLLCFPHAGGSARFFYPWLRELPVAIELLAVQYPGRDDRLDEPVLDRMDLLTDPLTEAVAEVADVPLVLFGHSMGASVAFEVARRLDSRSPDLVRHLFVSARPPPTPPTLPSHSNVTTTPWSGNWPGSAERTQRCSTIPRYVPRSCPPSAGTTG